MTDEKKDILSKIDILIKDIKSGEIQQEQIVAELKEIQYFITNNSVQPLIMDISITTAYLYPLLSG